MARSWARGQGRRLRPRCRGGRARRAGRRRRAAVRGRRSRGGRARRPARAGRRHGRADARGARGGAARPAPRSPRGTEGFAAQAAAGGTPGPRQARHRHGPAGHARPGQATRVAEAAGDRGRVRRRADDPLRHRRRARRRVLRRAARAVPRVGRRRCASASPARCCTPANSAATLRDPAAHLDLVRCGVAIYGLDPFQRGPGRPRSSSPALSLPSWWRPSSRARRGRAPGYGRRFVAREPTCLATVPIGYGDGWRRGLTNNAEVVIRGRRHPLVGTVSMDNVTVDVGPDAGGGGRRRGHAARSGDHAPRRSPAGWERSTTRSPAG